MFERALDPVSVCRESRWGSPSKKIRGETRDVVAGKVAHAADRYGSVFTRFHSQTHDLVGGHGVDRCDFAGGCRGSEQDKSTAWRDADPICRGSTRLFGGATVLVGERGGHERDDGGYDDQTDRGRRSRFDALADKDPTFRRGNFCSVIRGPAWRS
jgi:hypothetical protein